MGGRGGMPRPKKIKPLSQVSKKIVPYAHRAPAQRESQPGLEIWTFTLKNCFFQAALWYHICKKNSAIVIISSMALEKMSNRSKKIQVEASRRLLCASTPPSFFSKKVQVEASHLKKPVF